MVRFLVEQIKKRAMRDLQRITKRRGTRLHALGIEYPHASPAQLLGAPSHLRTEAPGDDLRAPARSVAFVVDRLSMGAAIDLAKRLGMKRLEPSLRERIQDICKADASRNCDELR